MILESFKVTKMRNKSLFKNKEKQNLTYNDCRYWNYWISIQRHIKEKHFNISKVGIALEYYIGYVSGIKHGMSFNTWWLRVNETWIRNTRQYKKIRNEQETIKNSGDGNNKHMRGKTNDQSDLLLADLPYKKY